MTARSLAVAVALASAAPATAQPPALEQLGFLAGCWRSEGANGAVLEEYYTPPSSNLMLGVSRFLRDGAVVDHEFSRIERNDTSILLTPHPAGTASVPFRLVRLAGDTVVFENPAHDFPQRILYRRDGSHLLARIETLAGDGREWRLAAIPCPRR